MASTYVRNSSHYEEQPWKRIVTVVGATVALILASPIGFIGLSALSFVIPTGMPSPPPGIGMVLIPFWLAGAFAAPVALLVAAIAQRRIELAAAALGVALLMWGTLEPARQLVRQSIYCGLSTVAGSSKPLIAALERYRVEKGSYPDDLAALVPGYLPELPATGLAAFPRYEYFRSQGTEPPAGYELSVPFSRSLLDFSAYQYWPKHDYPRNWPLVNPEIVGDWAIWYD